MARITGNVKEKIHTKAMQRFGDEEGVFLLRTPLGVLEAIEKMKGGVEIEYAEPNWIYTHSAVSTDPYYANGSLWGMDGEATSFGSQAEVAWAAGNTGSASVYVGIIDEGIQFDHSDLAGQIWTNPFDPLDGIDNDKNGYIDGNATCNWWGGVIRSFSSGFICCNN